LIRNEFGGSAGGPVILPTFGLNGKKVYDGHNRTFFFVSREQLYFRQGFTTSFSVPTAAQRQGNFAGLATNTGLPITLYDPNTGNVQTINNRPITVRSPFPGNIIPLTRESPLAKYVYSITPFAHRQYGTQHRQQPQVFRAQQQPRGQPEQQSGHHQNRPPVRPRR
jgi:hypothetical protein